MKRLTSATAIGMILASTPALAEVTPKSVWDNLNGYYTRSGMTVETAAVDEAGDTLTVKGLVLSQDQNGTKSRIDLGDLVLSATGDGPLSRVPPAARRCAPRSAGASRTACRCCP